MKYLLDGYHTDRLMFEKIHKEQFSEWLPFFQTPITSVHWVEPPQSPDVRCESWYHKQQWRYENNMGGMNALLEKSSKKLVGHAGLVVQTVDGVEELEIAYSLLPAFWKQGYAIEAARACKQFAFSKKLADSLISIISVSNIPSQHVAEKNGMEIEKTTRYKDNEVFIYRIQKP